MLDRVLDLDLGTYDGVAVAALAVGVIGILTALFALRAVRRMRATLARLRTESGEPSLVEATGRNVHEIDVLQGRTTSLQAGLDAAGDRFAAVSAEFAALRQELAGVRDDLTRSAGTEFATLREELAGVRGDLTHMASSGFAAMREETAGVRQDLSHTVSAEVAALREEAASLREDLNQAVRRVAVTRFDAFADVGGRMSFSVALLADDASGVVLTGITGRNETRVYAKRIVDGEGQQELSPEEREAVAAALGRQPVARER